MDFWLTSLHLFTNPASSAVSMCMQVSFLFDASVRKYKENLQFDRKRSEIWLVKTGHVKT